MEETKTTPTNPDCAAGPLLEGQIKRDTVSIDLEAYMPLLEEMNISDEQKMELLRSLLAIAASFVDLGFPIDLGSCGLNRKEEDAATKALRDHVYSSHQTYIENFENAAGSDADAAREGL